jgi:hypothetical protein
VNRLLLGACVLLAAAGCGGGATEVRGKVAFKGKPVENGTISFEPADGKGPTAGGPIADGGYRLTGQNSVSSGAKVVRIQAFGPSGRRIPAAPGSKVLVDELKQLIPAKYNSRSDLKATVEAGKVNTIDFALEP